jgi:hypothetical protein
MGGAGWRFRQQSEVPSPDFDQPISGRKPVLDSMYNWTEAGDKSLGSPISCAQPYNGRPFPLRPNPDGEVLVLADKDCARRSAPIPNIAVCAAGQPQIQYMLALMAARLKPNRQSSRQVRIDEKAHATLRRRRLRRHGRAGVRRSVGKR